ncbi:MAG: hypothetical protein KJ063_02435 [Anaerolineae bacterium]|nr:hypothetical protein [Anaerolineae bacterium]
MNNNPKIGGLHDAAHRINQLMDLDKASDREVRQYLLAGIVELHIKVVYIERTLDSIKWIMGINSAIAGLAIVLSSIALFSRF